MLVANYGGGSVVVLPITRRRIEVRIILRRSTPATASIRSGRKNRTRTRSRWTRRGGSRMWRTSVWTGSLIYQLDERKGSAQTGRPAVRDSRPGRRTAALFGASEWAFCVRHQRDQRAPYLVPPRSDTGELTGCRPFPRSRRTCRQQSVQRRRTRRASVGHAFSTQSIRGHNSIAVFTIDQTSGQLDLVSRTRRHGAIRRAASASIPRHYPAGGNQNSDSVVVFRIDAETGKLTPTGRRSMSARRCG